MMSTSNSMSPRDNFDAIIDVNFNLYCKRMGLCRNLEIVTCVVASRPTGICWSWCHLWKKTVSTRKRVKIHRVQLYEIKIFHENWILLKQIPIRKCLFRGVILLVSSAVTRFIFVGIQSVNHWTFYVIKFKQNVGYKLLKTAHGY